MDEINIEKVMRETIDWEYLDLCIRDKIINSIDYDELAKSVVEAFDITEFVKNELVIPF